MEQTIFVRRSPAYRPLILALVVSLFLMVIDHQHPEWIRPLRGAVHRAFDPIYQLANLPVLSREWLSLQVQSEDNLRRQVTVLHAELLASQVRVQKLAELNAENARLRGLLASPLLLDGRMMVAEIIGTDTDPLRHIVVINKGAADGVFDGQTVLDENGVLGQVMSVFKHSSRVLMVSDKEHGASVRVERTGLRGILVGTGDSTRLSLLYVPNTAEIQVGDRLVTSGLGNRFPAGYPIGTVSSVERHGSTEFANVGVKPLAMLNAGHHVTLLFAHPLAVEQAATVSVPVSPESDPSLAVTDERAH